ncbi:hypothetical protein UFOVP460_12 [uncultured Caudovirales phage]|uniref:Uncharacterized protein n=1 Tax=uncultured Caudovirales phage TaxID=2100421 RepID=A0A6J5MCU9_9CAUD|nr:hypothetical protein UFOVP460_12 [uncultured Caudovirales phage]
MAQISKGDTFTNGEQVTGSRLNQLVDGSSLLVGAITDQPSITANTLQSTDSTIVNDAGVLKEATIGDFLNSNLPITTSSITGVTGVDIVVAPAAGQKFDVNGALESTTNNTIGNSTVGGNQTVTGDLTVTGATTANGSFTSNGIANFTGTLQVNGSTGYVLTEVTEETIPSFVVSNSVGRPMNTWHNGFTSSTFTKPSDEIWFFEAVLTVNPASVSGVLFVDHFIYASNNANSVIYYNRQGKNIGNVAQTNSSAHTSELKWIVNTGTALTSETVKLWYFVLGSADYIHTFGSTSADASTGKAYPAAKLRIYKYRTA